MQAKLPSLAVATAVALSVLGGCDAETSDDESNQRWGQFPTSPGIDQIIADVDLFQDVRLSYRDLERLDQSCQGTRFTLIDDDGSSVDFDGERRASWNNSSECRDTFVSEVELGTELAVLDDLGLPTPNVAPWISSGYTVDTVGIYVQSDTSYDCGYPALYYGQWGEWHRAKVRVVLKKNNSQVGVETYYWGPSLELAWEDCQLQADPVGPTL